MSVEFFETIRGTEVKVFANHFEADPSVGLAMGPDEVYANILNEDGSVGDAFELTDEEVESLGIKATEIFDGLDNGPEMDDLRDLDLNEYFPFG